MSRTRKPKPVDPPEQLGCPWCGESFITAALKRKAGITVSARLVCFTCRAQGPIAPTLAEACLKWDTRVSTATDSHKVSNEHNEHHECSTANGTVRAENEQPITQGVQASTTQPGSSTVGSPVQLPGGKRSVPGEEPDASMPKPFPQA
jgi:hypothetical protein